MYFQCPMFIYRYLNKIQVFRIFVFSRTKSNAFNHSKKRQSKIQFRHMISHAGFWGEGHQTIIHRQDTMICRLMTIQIIKKLFFGLYFGSFLCNLDPIVIYKSFIVTPSPIIHAVWFLNNLGSMP